MFYGKVGISKFGQGSMITNTQIDRNHALHHVQNVTTVKPQFTRPHGEKDLGPVDRGRR